MTLAETRRWARVGVLAALALVFGYVETFIPLPVPVPGVKLGLANVVVLMALVQLDVKSAALVATVKVLAAGFLFGNPVMMLYSAGGTVLAFAAMAALSRIRNLSVVLVAVAGAILHNVGQLAVAGAILGTPLVWASAPVLVIAACATGGLSGVATRYVLDCLDDDALSAGRDERPVSVGGAFAAHSPISGAQAEASPKAATPEVSRSVRGAEEGRVAWRERAGVDGVRAAVPACRRAGGGEVLPGALACEEAECEADARPPRVREGAADVPTPGGLDVRAKLACLVAYVVVALHAHSPLAVALCLAAACACAFAVRLPARSALGVLRPLVPIVAITAVMQVLYFQQGHVVAQIGPVAVTTQALGETARMVVVLLCVMVASVAFMHSTTADELVRALRWLLGPARSAGARIDGFMLALSLAFRFAPVLVGEFQQLVRSQKARGAGFEGGVRARLAAYMRLFAPLVRSSFRRADTLAEASASRSFGCGATPTTLHPLRFTPKDAAACLATVLFTAAVLCLS